MTVALLTNHLVPYRLPLYARLAADHQLEVLCYGGGERYMGRTDGLDAAIADAAFPARRIGGWRDAYAAGRTHDVVIAPYAGGEILPAAYAGARRGRAAFVYWASIWARPRSPANDLAAPLTRHIQRHADAVVAYGEHARRYVARVRGRDDDVFIAPQSVEPELFGRAVGADEITALRARHELGDGPLVLFVGRLAEGKGLETLAAAWASMTGDARLVVAGEGPAAGLLAGRERVRTLGALAREELVVAYAAAEMVVVPSVPTPRFTEPWGLVVNEAMHQGTAVIASTGVGAAAGGLVRDGATGLVVPAGDAVALAGAVNRLLSDPDLRERLGAAGRAEVTTSYTYDAMVAGFGRAIATARARNQARRPGGRY